MKTFCSVAITIIAVYLYYHSDIPTEKEKRDNLERKFQPPPSWVEELVEKVKGKVILSSYPEYTQITKVHNGDCINKPVVVVVPESEKDVVEVVKLVSHQSLELSVRSGGHSYACTSSKVGGIHLDMRGLARVDLHNSAVSPSGWAATLGPGATWSQVLDKIPPDKWTVVHGQCLGVGVGGFLLGGGVNMVGSTTRYGAGMEQVLQYRMVTAAGEITIVERDAVKMVTPSGQVTNLTAGDVRASHDIWFGLHGAGASFGVVTEILYKVYPSPETLASVLPVWVSDSKDLQAIERAAWSKEGQGFQFGLYSLYYLRSARHPLAYPGLSMGRIMLDLQAFIAGEPGQPLVLSVADVRNGAGRKTNSEEVVNILESHGVRLMTSSSWFLDILAGEAGALGMEDYEGEYLGQEEKKLSGPQGMVSANLGGIKTVEAVANILLTDQVFGVSNKYSHTALATGCDYCFWAINFNTVPPRGPEARLALTREVGNLQSELTCMYPPGEDTCRTVVENTRTEMLASSLALGGTDSQYVNTPSCQGEGWERRYFGENYQKLLAVKKAWDPDNIFNYCHSVGSRNHDCCKQ